MRKPDPVEIVAVGAPVLIEAVCVTVTIACAIVLVAVLSMPWPT
jgi:hypothetical protein